MRQVLLAPTTFDPCLSRFDGSCRPISVLLSLEKRAKIRFMGHSKGRDNAKKRAKRRKKTERLALAKKKQRTAK